MEGNLLLQIITHFSKLSYFDVTIHTPEDYSIIEDYFEEEIAENENYLSQYQRIIETTLLLDNNEYQELVMQFKSDKQIARRTYQYIHCIEQRQGELTIINLIRDVRRRLKKKTTTKKRTVTKAKTVDEPFAIEKKSLSAIEAAKQMRTHLKNLAQALEAEDYLVAARIQKEIEELKGQKHD